MGAALYLSTTRGATFVEIAVLKLARVTCATASAAALAGTTYVCGLHGRAAAKQVSRTSSEPSVASPAGAFDAIPDTKETYLPEALTAGEKLCDFAAEALASVAICVVDGVQPSGAVGPTQVSRKNALLVLAVVLAAFADSAGCDSKATKRPSLLMEGEIFAPPRAEPSDA